MVRFQTVLAFAACISTSSAAIALEPFAGSYELGMVHSKFQYEVMKSRSVLDKLKRQDFKAVPEPCSEIVAPFEGMVTESEQALVDADKAAANGVFRVEKHKNQLRVHFEDLGEMLGNNRTMIEKHCLNRRR